MAGNGVNRCDQQESGCIFRIAVAGGVDIGVGKINPAVWNIGMHKIRLNLDKNGIVSGKRPLELALQFVFSTAARQFIEAETAKYSAVA